MRRRRLLVACLVGLLVAGLVVLLVAGSLGLRRAVPEHRIQWENFEVIRAGMTEQEVEALLGGPAGDYTTGPVSDSLTVCDCWFPTEVEKKWCGDYGSIDLGFDASGRVVFTGFVPCCPLRPSLIERCRGWLGL